MLLRELFQFEAQIFKEDNDAENITVDWNQLKAALTVIATDPDLKGVKPVDAIMFLGLIGDPNADPLKAKQKGPARFGVLTPQGMNRIPRYQHNGLQGEYQPQGVFQKDTDGNLVSFEKFDIILSPKYWQALTADTDTPELVAHEARHRGFDILFTNPATLARIPKELQNYREKYWTGGENGWPMKFNDQEYWDSWEHMCLWSLERRGQAAFGQKGYIFASKEEMLQFRRWYYQLEAVAKDYVATVKVPAGGYEALRSEIDKKTPSNMEIQVKPDANGKPIVVGKLSAQEIERRNKDIQAGKNIDKQGNTVKSGTVAPGEIYTVQARDSLSKIAAAHGISLPAIIKANPQFANPDLIYPGDQVNIPKKL